MAMMFRHPDPQYQSRGGRARRHEDPEDSGWRQPLLNLGAQGFKTKGIREAHKSTTVYQEMERLYRPFWEKARLRCPAAPVRSSSIALLNECPRRFMFKCRLGLEPVGDYAAALETGHTAHELLAELYRGQSLDSIRVIAARRISELYTKYSEAASVSGLLPNGRTLTEQMIQVEQDQQMALAMVQIWAYYMPPEKLLENHDVVSIEQRYTVKVPGVRVPVIIQPDVILRHRKTRQYWVVDHKTYSGSGQDRAAVLPFELQPRLYQWIWGAIVEADRVVDDPPNLIGGYIHNLLKKCTLRYCPNGKDKDGGFEGYVARVHEWYKEQELKDPNDPPFIQSVVPAPVHLLDEELAVQVHQTALASNARLNLARFHRNDKVCFKFGKPCPYLGLCRAPVPQWPRLIKANYIQHFREEDENQEAND